MSLSKALVLNRRISKTKLFRKMNQPPPFCFANEAAGVSCGERTEGRKEEKYKRKSSAIIEVFSSILLLKREEVI